MPSLDLVEANGDVPVAKRQRVAEPPVNAARSRKRIFAPFRTVGLISPTSTPFTTLPLGKTSFQITTSVGRCLQTYDLARGLNLVFLTRPQTPEDITATVAWKSQVLAAWGGQNADSDSGVWVFKRGRRVAELEMPRGAAERVQQLLVLGSWIVGCCNTRLEVWKASTLEHYTTLVSPYSKHGAAHGNQNSGGICNLPTYLNKVAVGKSDGSVELWNVSSGKLLYTFLPSSSHSGAVTAMQPAPAVSLLAIAYESGPVVIHDIRADKEVLRVNTGSTAKYPVTSISFRTDDRGAGSEGQKSGVMATASNQLGDVTLWDLNRGGRKTGVLRGAHNPPSTDGKSSGGVSKVEFLAGQDLLVTSGLDNSLKTWIFDATPFSPIPRILHSRSGHAAPISTLQFLPSDFDGADAGGKWLLSASEDRSLWGWSLRRDGQSTEISQGKIQSKAKKMGILSSGLASLDDRTRLEDLKASKITCMACSLNRDGGVGAMPGTKDIWQSTNKTKKGPIDTTASSSTGWESIVTGHEGDKAARTWFWGRKKAGRWALETGDGASVASVAMSQCGTFALVGSASGGIDMYNLQSGIHRQRFPARISSKQAKMLEVQQEEEDDLYGALGNTNKKFAKGQGKHAKAVTGIVVDSLNRTIISCGADGKIKFWDFATGLLLYELSWFPVTIHKMQYHRASDLIALSCTDGCLRLVDITTRKLVRELPSASDIVDFTFSNDGRWIIAASLDSTVRIWDLLTGHLIDGMKFRDPITAIAFSNTGEHLATAQTNNVGVQIWTNRSLFTHVSTRQISEAEIPFVDAPTVSGEGGQGLIAAANEFEEEVDEEAENGADAAGDALDQLTADLTTLSLVPKSRWQNLFHLDLVRARNKPKEPPKPPEKAPFFLPSLGQQPDSLVTKPNGVSASLPETPTDTALATTDTSRISKTSLTLGSNDAANDFTRHLTAATRTQNYEALISHLSTLPPSSADLAIRTISIAPPYTEPLTYIRALTAHLRTRRDYELVQAWMAVFLRLHSEIVTSSEEGAEDVREALREWRYVLQGEKEKLAEMGRFVGGVVGWVRSGI